MDTGTERVLARKDGAVGWITFNNPARRNAMSHDMWQAVPKVLEAYAADPDIRLVVLTGAGDKAFVSGADISQFEDQRANQQANDRYGGLVAGATAALTNFPKPTLAMIRGFCIGGGLAVALSCDMRITADDGRFGIPAARLGLGYGFDGLRVLMGVVGPAFAKEIMFTARQFTAAEALAMGLVNRVVPVAELEATVADYAAMIAANAPMTVAASKLAVNEALKDAGKRDMAAVHAATDACFNSADYAEGRAAFMEKRKAVFVGK